MAIADAIAPQFGRIPMILDDALEGMHGPALDRVIRCLVDYTKRGQQVLLATSDEEVASRVRAHHGWVCHLKDIVRAKVAPPVEQRFVYEERPYRTRPNYDAAEINRQLHAYANEQASTEWLPEIDRSVASIRPVVSTNPVVRPVVGAGAPQQYFLSERSWIEEVPGVDQRFFCSASTHGDSNRRRSFGIRSTRDRCSTSGFWSERSSCPSMARGIRVDVQGSAVASL